MSATLLSRQTLRLLFLLPFLCLAVSDDHQILLKIKAAFQKSNTNKIFDSWESNNSTFSFAGITCHTNGSVIGIDLSHQHLAGSVPFDLICQLKSLEKLSLGFNFLNGRIPDELNKCVGLKYLDLGNNFFSGAFPEISSLSGLMYLYVNMSGFSGTFPWTSVENMKSLVVLSLGDNPFDRTPFPKQVLELTNLNSLFLANCSISGEIPPEIGNLTELINLELSRNYISGEIPAEITKLQKLWQLELFKNEFTGELPVGFGILKNLEMFDASSNFLRGNLSEIRHLNQLVSLQLYGNEFTGEIPAELGEFRNLMNLSIYRNKLTGELPQKLGSLSNFNFIDASENSLTGPIPPDMCKQGKMTELLLIQNRLTGQIPANYASCDTLTRFRVSNNSLSGVVPSGIWGLPKVGMIDVAINQFEGPISSDIGNAKSLGSLLLSNNRLSGRLPQDISKVTSLVSIDLSNNMFSSEFPAKIGELKQLSSLHLENNKFSGKIPESLGSCDSLSDMNMARNSLSGQIPSSLGTLPALNTLNLSTNQLSGEIPDSLSSLRLSLLDLSHNQLTGPVPESLSIEAYNGSFAGNSGLCSQSIRNFPFCSTKSGEPGQLRTLILCFTLGSVALLLSIACLFYTKKSQKDHERSLKDDSWDVKSFHVLSFTEDEILDAIKQQNLIGKGGSGNVYRVTLTNGLELAVKHIWNSRSGGWKKTVSTSPMLAKPARKLSEFDAEVQALSSIRHLNVVKLYCSITNEDSSLLVYEYLPNGSLWDKLHTCSKMALDWDTRYAIALGAAKGLEYLHHGCERPVIHRDVKSSNILLDEFLKPRIADFGLAKIVQANANGDSTHVIAGTYGYIAPEYGYTYKVDEKSDVYSFGVVLMELVTGKRPIEPEFGENKDIVNWVCTKLKTKETLLGIVDSTISEGYKEDAIKMLRIAILCTARLPALRPTMRSVVQMLEDAERCKLLGIIINKDCQSQKDELKV